MKQNFKKIYIILAILITVVSCDKFVDVIPKGRTIPQTVDDLAKLMNCGSSDDYGNAIVPISSHAMDSFTDDYFRSENPSSIGYIGRSTELSINFYKWKSNITYSRSAEDMSWDWYYKSNYVVNYILENIDRVEDGQSYQRNEVRGRALVHRAMTYFLLTNYYGKGYNKQTSSTDLSVPLVTVSNINKQYPRATVAEVYAQILKDLNEALDNLKIDVPDYNHIPGRATAYAVRARVYLWMQEYDKAYSDAVESLNMRSKLTDYNSFTSLVYPEMPIFGPTGYESDGVLNEEITYYRKRMSVSSVPLSNKLLSIIDQKNDLRFSLFYGTYGTYYPEPISLSHIVHSGINTAEVWLIKAESALRKSSPNISEAIAALDYVRIRRIAKAAYTPTTENDPSKLLKLILDERRRELTSTDMSFMDQKRQNADPSTAREMKRTILGEEYTLSADSPIWQLAIPLNVMDLNPLLIQNEL